MYVEVICRDIKKYIYTNIISFTTIVKLVGRKSVRYVLLKQKDKEETIAIGNVTSFLAYEEKIMWIEKADSIICPYCDAEFEKDAYMNKSNHNKMKFCPQCGNELKY